ncbi:PLD nuclease N-terminal domain-containing protein [Lewinella sp. JB7]|uniref:PLD nuclease N-terminal domain-containing protein n=1 Tax=Lewinella sp. JB7 TaxID=2962887 RepID=UPI0020C9D1DC|nr:PLD nuclease N-terminal domain-containing protein [Lewinella sp. JB7]MCP9236235.1 PLD nuclease N-terminal domain-containing protein [Lewinella sp. JB7]
MNIRRILPVLPFIVLLTACGENVSAGEAMAGGMGIMAIGGILALIIIVLAVLDLIKKPYPMEKKLIWGAIIFFIPFLGALLYFILGRNKQSVF